MNCLINKTFKFITHYTRNINIHFVVVANDVANNDVANGKDIVTFLLLIRRSTVMLVDDIFSLLCRLICYVKARVLLSLLLLLHPLVRITHIWTWCVGVLLVEELKGHVKHTLHGH